MDKSTVRNRLLACRKTLPTHARKKASGVIESYLTSLPVWKTAETIIMYLPVNAEVDTWNIFNRAQSRGSRTLLPCCRKNQPGGMDFFNVMCHKELILGMYDIPEPDPNQCVRIEHPNPDLVILPGVGFDRQGYRLGYGGGYYDRFLAEHNMASALIIGLGFSCQIVDRLPHDPWDKKVDLVITEKETIWTETTPHSKM